MNKDACLVAPRRRSPIRRRHLISAILAVIFSGSACPSAEADPADVSRHLSRGNDAYRTGDLAEATRQWTEAIRVCRIDGNVAGETEAVARRGEALQSMGFLRDAFQDLTTALDRAERSGDVRRTAAAAGALGSLHVQARDFAAARPLITRSIELAKQQDDAPVLAASYNNLGNLLASSGERGPAVAAYDESRRSAARAGDRALEATALVNKARLQSDEGAAEPARRSLGEALTAAEALPPSRDKVLALVAIGRLASRAATGGAAPEAAAGRLGYDAFRKAALDAEASADQRGRSLAYGYLGELYERQAGRREDSEALTDRAIFAAQQANAPDLLYRWEWQRGRLYRDGGDSGRAIASYRRAVAALQSVRQDIPVEYRDGRSSFRDTIGPMFLQLADLLLRETRRGQAADGTASLLTEARDTVELIKAAELRDYFQDQCIAALQAKTRGIEGLAARTAAIYPVILPDRLELLVSFPDGRQQVTVPVDQETLTAEVRRLRFLLEKRTSREYLGPARRVYDWVVRPLEGELARRGIETLVWMPDGPLRTVPLAALHDGNDFVVSRYAVAVAPGLTLVDPTPLARDRAGAKPRTLVTGLSEPVQGYPPLPNVMREIEAVGQMQGGTVLANENFRRAEVERLLRTAPFSIVHIASHGEFDSDPAKTFVLTFDGKMSLDELEKSIKFSEFRDEPLELLTLSACRTAAGDDRAALGLAGVAIKAGARSALASLWSISDQAVPDLVTDFYGRLGQPGMTKAKALQQAQLALMGDRRFRHPGYWSAFLVIGNWL